MKLKFSLSDHFLPFHAQSPRSALSCSQLSPLKSLKSQLTALVIVSPFGFSKKSPALRSPLLIFQETVIVIYFKNYSNAETWHPRAAPPTACGWHLSILHPFLAPHTPTLLVSSLILSPSFLQAQFNSYFLLRLEDNSPAGSNTPDTTLMHISLQMCAVVDMPQPGRYCFEPP